VLDFADMAARFADCATEYPLSTRGRAAALLREMKDSIDRYKDAADKNLIRVEVGNRRAIRRILETLVTGVNVGAGRTRRCGSCARFDGPDDESEGLGKRCVSDDPDSTSCVREECIRCVFQLTRNGQRRAPYSEMVI